MPNWEALKHYKPVACYSSARNELIDIIIKKGYARYQAEAILNALWKLYDKDSKQIARVIVGLKGNEPCQKPKNKKHSTKSSQK